MTDLTPREMIEYVTLTEKSPEAIRFVARVNGLMAADPILQAKIQALEAVYDALSLPPDAAREALWQMKDSVQDEAYREM